MKVVIDHRMTCTSEVPRHAKTARRQHKIKHDILSQATKSAVINRIKASSQMSFWTSGFILYFEQTSNFSRKQLEKMPCLSFKRVAASSQGQRIRANSTLKTTTSSGAGPPYEFLSATPPLQTSQIITRNPPQKVYFDRPDIAVLLPSFIPLYLGNWFRQLGRWCWQASCRKLCSPQQQSRAGRAVQGLAAHGTWHKLLMARDCLMNESCSLFEFAVGKSLLVLRRQCLWQYSKQQLLWCFPYQFDSLPGRNCTRLEWRRVTYWFPSMAERLAWHCCALQDCLILWSLDAQVALRDFRTLQDFEQKKFSEGVCFSSCIFHNLSVSSFRTLGSRLPCLRWVGLSSCMLRIYGPVTLVFLGFIGKWHAELRLSNQDNCDSLCALWL